MSISNGYPAPTQRRSRPANRQVGVGLAVSFVLHALVVLYLLWGKESHQRGGRAAPRHAVVIALSLDSFTPPPLPPAPPTPPKPKSDQATEKAPKPTPTPPHRAAAAQKSTAQFKSDQTKPLHDQPDDTDDVIGRIHDNWLEPPGINRGFHCKVQIDYAVGGAIVEVRLLEGCGSPVLDDSVKRAVWKTQPLPVVSAKQQAGRLEIEFSP